MWAWDSPRRRVTTLKKLTTLAGSRSSPCWLEHMACGGKEHRNVACRGRIPQSGLGRREYRNLRYTRLAFGMESHTTQTPLPSNDLTLRLRENPPFYLKAMIEQARER